jgi:hypothetical protein
MMARIDWLRDVGTGLGKDVLAIALEIWVNLEVKRRMGRMDWTGWASVTDGKDMEGERKGRAGLVRINWGESVCRCL